nr:cyclic nucleotide-binding domain-containing protein [Lactococcus lactis]
MSKYKHHFSHHEHHCVRLVPLFGLLSESELMQVEQVVNHKIFEKGETVISPFAVPQLAIVAHGTLKIYQLSSAGKEQLLRVIEPGGYAGEDALFGVMNDNLYGETLEET